MAVSFLTGQRLTADLLNTNVIAFMPTVPVVKTVATARQSTTTLADDPELQGVALSTGTWDIEVVIFYTVSSTTPKLKFRYAFTGTWNGGSAFRASVGPGSTNVAAPDQVTEASIRGVTLDTQDATVDSSTSAGFSVVREVARNVVVTVAGNMSVQWAQSVSTASNVTVQSGSHIRIQKTA